MKRLPAGILSTLMMAALALAGPAAAQFNGVTLPPSGGNQRAAVSQTIGLVRVSIDYSSPHVHSPVGEDRKGKIWGKLVPYGMANLGFGTCGGQCPWRGGANENTVFTTSHAIKVQGEPLPAGSYGLHFIPGAEEWTIIFSKNSTSWGSFSYDAKEDALRVKAKPEASAEYREVLTYEFPERKQTTATAALKWENLQLPFVITVGNMNEIYVENMRRELRSTAGFSWTGWNAAAQWCLTEKINIPEAQKWAENSVDASIGGQENFTTLTTLSELQAANGHAAEAEKTMDKALNHPSAGPLDLHLYGRQLLARKKAGEAMKVFQLNAKRHPNVWPVHVGLARGYAALGQHKEALEEARRAVPQAPNDGSRRNLETLIQQLQEGKAVD